MMQLCGTRRYIHRKINMDTYKLIAELQALIRQKERDTKARELYLLYRIRMLEEENARLKNDFGDK